MSWHLSLVTPPAVEPVTLDEVKKQLNVTHNDDDIYIESLITAARTDCENGTNLSFISTVWNQFYGCWRDCFELRRAPVSAVSEFEYTDITATETAVDPTLYVVDVNAKPGQVRRAFQQLWPSVYLQPIETAIRIKYTAGYGATAASVPGPIKQAILLQVTNWYENRSPVIVGQTATVFSELPLSVRHLLGPYRNWYF